MPIEPPDQDPPGTEEEPLSLPDARCPDPGAHREPAKKRRKRRKKTTKPLAGQEVEKKKKGPPATLLDAVEKVDFLDKVERGVGRRKAMIECRFGYARFRRTMEEDDDFRQAVETAEKSRTEIVKQTLLSIALQGDMDAIKYYLDRRDKARERAIRNRQWKAEFDLRAQLELMREERLMKQALLAHEVAMADVEGKYGGGPDRNIYDFSGKPPETVRKLLELLGELMGGNDDAGASGSGQPALPAGGTGQDQESV